MRNPVTFEVEALESRQAATLQLTIHDHRSGTAYTVTESSKRNKGEPYIQGRGTDFALVRALRRLAFDLEQAGREEIRMTRR